MKKAWITLMLATLAVPAFAQLKTPRPSLHSALTQTVGLTDVTITYSRPGVKGRKIWGGLVPYGQVWRTGANEATTISFSDDVTINGKDLPKGSYSLHTIPGADEWTLIFNKVADQWGSYSYDEKQDALRVTAKPRPSLEKHEWLTFDAPELSADQATFVSPARLSTAQPKNVVPDRADKGRFDDRGPSGRAAAGNVNPRGLPENLLSL